MTFEHTIVVGLDHSPAGIAALRWATEEADQQQTSVTVLRVLDPDLRSDLALGRDLAAEQSECHRATGSWVFEALEGTPHASLRILTRIGSVEPELVAATDEARLLGVGQPQDPRLLDLPLRLARRSHCPVVCVDQSGHASFVGRTHALA